MKTKKKPKVKKEVQPKNKKKFRINWLLVFALICVAIPTGALAYVLLTASMETGTPVIGERFENSFTYQLTDEDIKVIESDIKGIAGVDKVIINKRVATVRIYVDVDDSLSKGRIEEIAVEIYELIDISYPIYKYFTVHDKVTQYDLEIYVYNNMDFEDNFIYIRLIKNATSEEPTVQNVGEPMDPALAERLRAGEKIEDSGTTGVEANEDSGEEELDGD